MAGSATWEERLRFNSAAPSREGLARMARALRGRSAAVLGMRRLSGGLDGSTHAIRVDPGGWVVLKRSLATDPAWLAGEFTRLEVARLAAVPTPDPLALDAEGEWFGRPALVMSRLPGRGTVHVGPGPWIDEVAAALAAIHGAALPERPPAALRSLHAGLSWRPPEPAALRRTPRVEALIGLAVALQGGVRRQPAEPVLLHHDFHPGNVLWHRGRLAGVVDWSEATIGPAVCDVGYCSVDIAMTHGIGAAARFGEAYRRWSGRECGDLRRWQALWTVNAMRWAGHWVSSFQDAGADHVTLPLMRRHLRAFADRLLATR